MATSTRTDTTYSATLLRLHALEEYNKAEIAAIKARLAELEKSGGGGDPVQRDRIYTITMAGSQSPASADPQGQGSWTTQDIQQVSSSRSLYRYWIFIAFQSPR